MIGRHRDWFLKGCVRLIHQIRVAREPFRLFEPIPVLPIGLSVGCYLTSTLNDSLELIPSKVSVVRSNFFVGISVPLGAFTAE